MKVRTIESEIHFVPIELILETKDEAKLMRILLGSVDGDAIPESASDGTTLDRMTRTDIRWRMNDAFLGVYRP